VKDSRGEPVLLSRIETMRGDQWKRLIGIKRRDKCDLVESDLLSPRKQVKTGKPKAGTTSTKLKKVFLDLEGRQVEAVRMSRGYKSSDGTREVSVDHLWKSREGGSHIR